MVDLAFSSNSVVHSHSILAAKLFFFSVIITNETFPILVLFASALRRKGAGGGQIGCGVFLAGGVRSLVRSVSGFLAL